MTVINIRGTGGSGKSTVVRRIMEAYPDKKPGREWLGETRKQPFHYTLLIQGQPLLYVPGHYETACGGCDTIKTVNQVYDMVRAHAIYSPQMDVLYEGIMVQDDVRRAVELNKELEQARVDGLKDAKLVVIGLTTPVEECLAAIRARRETRGDERPLNPKNTVDRHKRLQGTYHRLRANGIAVEMLGREEAYQRCRTLLRLDPGATSTA